MKRTREQADAERQLVQYLSPEQLDALDKIKIGDFNAHYAIVLQSFAHKQNASEAEFRHYYAETLRIINERLDAMPPDVASRIVILMRPAKLTKPLTHYAFNNWMVQNDEEYVTEKCFENFDITQLQCATSRMATGDGVYVCPILVDNPKARMGNNIQETLRPFPLSHSACYTCRVTGMTCKSLS